MNITYAGPGPRQRESQAVTHLSRVLPAAEANGLITSWWFIRKGAWRVRYLLTNGRDDPAHRLLTHVHPGVGWTDDIYEPEVHAFGGLAGMDVAHTLFHHDSRHLLTYLGDNPGDRRERSLVLCTALMRAAGLDLNEQGDVWARVAEQRSGLADQPSAPDPDAWASLTRAVRQVLLGTARPDTIERDWLAAFEHAGHKLRTLREAGELTRGIRAVVALHVIFHWNRIGLRAVTQSTVARAAKDAVFDG